MEKDFIYSDDVTEKSGVTYPIQKEKYSSASMARLLQGLKKKNKYPALNS